SSPTTAPSRQPAKPWWRSTREEQTLHGTLDDAAAKAAGWLKEANSGLGARPHPGRDDAADRGRHLPGVDFSSIDFAALQRALGATGRSSFLDPSQFPTASRGQADARPDAPGRRCAPDYAELLQRYYLLTATEKARIYLDGWARARAPTRTCRN
ncbi:MAG: hypothetical protein WKF54_10390, partial [Nocardioidaceae bacterium]